MAICVSNVYAVEIIDTLSYWYSDYNSIGKWASSPTFSSTETESCPSSFSTDVSTAFSAWNSADVPNSYTSTFSNADIPVYGGTYTEIKQIFPTFPSTSTGYTALIANDTNAYYSTPAGNKKAYTMVSVEVYIATDRANTKTYKHEAGHALGWFGHSSSQYDIMYDTASSSTLLTTRDKNHLNQIY